MIGYRVKLNCADRVRYQEVAARLGLVGDDLIKLLLRDFFNRQGVKNPDLSAFSQGKKTYAQKV